MAVVKNAQGEILGLKSDYFRIEISFDKRKYSIISLLKSDYFRIEIWLHTF